MRKLMLWFGPFWKKWWALIVALLVIVVIGLIYAGYWAPWTGFTERSVDSELQPAKTLWDWMDLLLVPVILAAGAAIFTWVTDKRQQEVEERRARAELEAAEQHIGAERATQADRARETALQTFLDRMTDQIEKGLHKSKTDDACRGAARARTLTVLRQLDGKRKGLLLRFLYESNLVTGAGVIRLHEADLHEADLYAADLYQANLHEANLRGTDLRLAILLEVNLRGARLGKADLGGADLSRADLSEADLTGAIVTIEQLSQAKSLKGATMPDGTIYAGDPPLVTGKVTD